MTYLYPPSCSLRLCAPLKSGLYISYTMWSGVVRFTRTNPDRCVPTRHALDPGKSLGGFQMFSTPDTLSVERCAAFARIRSVLRVLMTIVALVALGAPLMAQEAPGEVNLKLPRLDSVTFLGGISGSNLLMGGL